MNRADAAPVVFTVDQTQTEITISGTLIGTPIEPQAPNSLTTHFGGTILADVTDTTVQFTGGSAIDAEVNGTWLPGPKGAAGSAPGDYAGQLASFLGNGKGAFRNILLDVTSGVLALNTGSFDAAGLAFGLPANSNAVLDYDLGFLKGGLTLTGLSTNRVTTAGTITRGASGDKLVILVDTQYGFKALTVNDSVVRFLGKIVATRTGTVPTTVVIGPVGIIGNKLSFTATGAGDTAQLQNSTDLKSWQPRTAERKVEVGKVTFTVEASGGVEFFRIAQ